MPVSLVIPWRPAPSRMAAFDHVRSYYLELLAEAGIEHELVLQDSQREQFNLAEARNRGVAAARFETILLVDADSIGTRQAVLEAIAAAGDNRTHYCFDEFTYLDGELSDLVIAGAPIGALQLRGGPHESSIMVVTKRAYWDAGGMDERFVGWGGEDNAFRAATDTLNGGSHWHRGIGISLYHDDVARSTSQANLDLVARYRAAWKNRSAMHALIFEDHRVSVTP